MFFRRSPPSSTWLSFTTLWPTQFAPRVRHTSLRRRVHAQRDRRSPRAPLSEVGANLCQSRTREIGTGCRRETVEFDGVPAKADAPDHVRLGKGTLELTARGLQLRVRRPPMKLAPAIEEFIQYKQALGSSYTSRARVLKAFLRKTGNLELDAV